LIRDDWDDRTRGRCSDDGVNFTVDDAVNFTVDDGGEREGSPTR
jgi:hypothetical protein